MSSKFRKARDAVDDVTTEIRWLRADPINLARTLAAAMGSRRDLENALTFARAAFPSPAVLATFLGLKAANHSALVAALERGTYGPKLDAALRSSAVVRKALRLQAGLMPGLKRRQRPFDPEDQDSPEAAEDLALGFLLAASTTAAQLSTTANTGGVRKPETPFLRHALNFLTPPQRRTTKKGLTPDWPTRKAAFLKLVIAVSRTQYSTRLLARHEALADATVAEFMRKNFIGKTRARTWLNEIKYPRAPKGNPRRRPDGRYAAKTA